MIIVTQKQVEQEFFNLGYKLLEPYNGNNTPILCEKNGFRYSICRGNLLGGRKPTTYGFANPYWEYNMRYYINQTFQNVEILNVKIITKKHGKHALFTFKCECGKNFARMWDSLYRNNTHLMCKECSKKKRGKKRRTNANKIISLFNNAGYKILSDTSDITAYSKLDVIDKYGYKGKLSYHKLCQGSTFKTFSIKNNKDNIVYNLNNYIKINNLSCSAIELSNTNKHARFDVKFKCNCGNIYETTVATFIGGKIRCDKCSHKMSKGEYNIAQYLDELGISYIQEFRINSCRDILPLPFDFYLTDYNKFIEFDGMQHYIPASFANDYDSEYWFNITNKHDAIKNEYCKKYNIPLLRISYKDKDYKDKIIQFIKE